MPKVLVIRYEGQPFQVRMSKLLRTMLDAGWQVDVLIPRGGLGAINVSREMGRDLSGEVTLLEFPHDLPRSIPQRLLYRLTGTGFFGSTGFRLYLTGLLSTQNYDVIWAKDTPILPAVFHAIEKSGHSPVRVVCDMYENITEQVYDTFVRYGRPHERLLTLASLLISRLRRAERLYLPRCDRIFVVVDTAKAFLVRRYGLDPSRITVVHNVEILADFDAIELGPPLLDKDVPLISFVGGFGPHRGIDTLLEAVGLLVSRGEARFRLALVGASGSELARLESVCRERGLQEVVVLRGFLSHRDAMRWMKQSDIGVIPHVNTLQIRTTIPNKLFQYMAAGVPCIVSDVGPLGRIVRQTGCGLTFPAGDAHALAAILAELLSHPERMLVLGRNGRVATERQYRWEIEGQEYALYLLGHTIANQDLST
ncbi:MAG: glycosyltransferase family 4 protein [Chloroflexota bacterium]|nr:glycosyltransferase family 4 protein [Chloroflexota bacterium]